MSKSFLITKMCRSSNEGGDTVRMYGYEFRHEKGHVVVYDEKGNVVLHAQSISEAVQDLREEEE